LNIEEIFPIRYDVSLYARGNISALVGSIPAQPRSRLGRDEIIKLALKR
jgi:hypothetical protein